MHPSVLVLMAVLGPASAAAEIRGQLDSKLHSRDAWVLQLQEETSHDLSSRERRWSGTLKVPPKVFFRTGGTAEVLLVESPRHPPRLSADLNRDGAIGADEQVPHLPSDSHRWVIRFPFPDAPAGHWPVLAILKSAPAAVAGTRKLQLDESPYVTGRLTVQGREIRVRLPFDLRRMEADPSQGYLGMDADGDGVINTDPLSPEFTYANREDVVFRVLDRFVSVQAAAVADGTLILNEHAATAYERFDLRIGAKVPDFGFQTTDGRTHQLSDFDGQYVLLFVWDTGCFFAAEEIPTLRKAVDKFGRRGFTVLGLSNDEDETKAKQYVEKQGMHWPKVVGEHARQIIRRRLRAVGLPTVILLDRQRRVISRNREGEPVIRGEGLIGTLEELLEP